MLEKLLEEELESTLREAVTLELKEELERRGLDSKGVPAKVVNKKEPVETTGPRTRSKARKQNKASSPGQGDSSPESMKSQFDKLYLSGLWKEDYEIKDNKNNCSVM